MPDDTPPQSVTMVDPSTGRAADVPHDQINAYRNQGFTLETPDQRSGRLSAEVRESLYGGAQGAAIASTAGVLRGATLGGTDVLARALGGEDSAIALSGYRDLHPGLSFGSELAGAIIPAFFSGGESLPVSLAGRAGRAVAEGFGGGIGGAIAGGLTEGAVFGAGQGVSELALDDRPLTVEHVGSTLSSHMLYGAAFGGALGGAGKAMETGLQKARGAVQEFAARQAAARELVSTGAIEGDLAGLDAKGLRAARETELDRLAADHAQARVVARSAAVDDAVAYRQTVKDADPWAAVSDAEGTAPLYRASKTLRNAMDDVKGLRDNPAPLLKPLRVEEQALEGAIANREAIATKLEQVNQKIALELGEDLATLPSRATTVDLEGKAARRYASFADVKLAKGGSLSVPRDEAQGFLEAIQRGDVSGQGQQALAKLPELLEQNRALQIKIKEAAAPLKPRGELASERLAAIENAQDVLRAPRTEPSLGTKLLSHVGYGAAAGLLGHIPVVGHALGAIVGSKVADAIAGAMGKVGGAAAEASKRAASAVTSFLDVASKGAARAPLATQVLTGLRYGQPDQKSDAQARDLPGVFKSRTDEIKRQVHIAQDGSFQMTTPAREVMAKNFDGIRVKDPILADRLESYAARKIAWLASQIPRMPDAFASSLGPVKWQPPDLEMRAFARKCAAAEDPMGVLERVASGHVTPEDVLTMINVHPEIRNQYIADVSANIATLRKTLPYSRKLSMSIFTGVPIDPAMHPAVLPVLQDQFASEPGSMGGTQAPKPQPQYGSLKKSPDAPTPAQSRAQGAHR